MIYWIKDLESVLYPRCCPGCYEALYRHEKLLCLPCMVNLPLTRFEIRRDNPMRRAFMGRIPIEFAVSLWYFRKGTLVQKLLHGLKYKGEKKNGVIMGIWLGKSLMRGWPKEQWPDCIVPMPISKKRKKARGYNQAEMIALGLHQATGIPLKSQWVKRSSGRGSQTRLGRWARWENVSQEFELNPAHVLNPCHILLVDDVMTTGASIEALGRTLLNTPGIRISIATLAYTETG